MSKALCSRVSTITLLFTLLMAPMLQANTLQELHQQERVTLTAWLDKDQVSPKEQVVLTIELATDTWFLGGSRIGNLEIDNAMVLRRQKLATNFTDRRNGNTWSVQQFEITLYPQASGDYLVPQVAVDLTVAGDGREKLSGTLLTPPLEFAARLPSPRISQDSLWLVGEDYQLDVQHSVPPGEGLQVGDALTVRWHQQGSNTTGMLLPRIEPVDVGVAKAYPGQEDLQDTQNRGQYRASRTDAVTYMIRDGGELVLPARQILWWDPVSEQLTAVPLPEARWAVSHTPVSWFKAHWPVFAWTLLGLLVLALLRPLLRKLPRPAILDYARALWQGDLAEARRLLYRRRRLQANSLSLPGETPFAAWQQQVFGQDADVCARSGYWRLWWRTGIEKHGKRWQLPPALPALHKDRHDQG